MKSRQPLILDLNYLFKPFIKNGLDHISSLEKDFKQIHQGIKILKQTGHLPYAKLPSDDIQLENVLTLAKKYKDYDNILVFGIGGSALGASSLYQALGGHYRKGFPRLYVLDHIEACSLLDVLNPIKKKKNLYVFISKSGNTSETLAQFLLVKKFSPKLNYKDVVIITGTKEGFLKNLITKHHISSLPIPSGVGGRFSVFSSVGLFPLAVAGVDIKLLLDGANHAVQMSIQDVLAQNPAGLLAMTLYEWISRKKITEIVVMPYSNRLRFFPDWFSQLWSESLGKRLTLNGEEKFLGTSILKNVGVTDQHSQLQLYLEGPKNKIVLFIEIDDTVVDGRLSDSKYKDDRIDFLSGKSLHELMKAEKIATEETLRENNRPSVTLKMSMLNEFQLGQLYQLMMDVIPYLGALFNINAFDQPAVERIKKFTFGLMGRMGFEDFKFKVRAGDKKKELIF